MNNNPATLGFSIASKLSFLLWARLLTTFIVFNMVFAAAAIVGIVIYAETTLVNVAEIMSENGFQDESHLITVGVQVKPYQENSPGLIIPTAVNRFFPEETREGVRSLTL